MGAGWLLQEAAPQLALVPVRLGPRGIAKQIFLGVREADEDIAYLRAFIELARRGSLPTEPA